jgi:N,N-dimethylformamidase
MIYDRYLDQASLLDEASDPTEHLFARWDFSVGMSTTQIHDIGPHALNGSLINYPARAMTGWNWDGSEMCWRHAPWQYGAIHFHDDDIYDFNWETDFVFDVPDHLKSGVYGIRLTHGDHTDTIPLVVCPPRGQQTARLCVLISTFTWTVYGNHARPDYNATWQDKIKQWNAYPWNPAAFRHYGLSTYNFHNDGSGICHSSHLRPLFNLRPGYLTFGASECSGLRHFQADSHLTAWLEAKGYDYDVITDEALHEEGAELLTPYAAVTTGTHPEYHTRETLDALQAYRDQGGHLAYLGGNGFYWRVALHPENKGLIEIRRAEGGIRAWAAEPGEYYSAMDGTYGGLWRRNGRPPQRLAGVGFSAQGTFSGSYYRRTAASYDQNVAWMFDGIEDEILGDFGLCGGGAAGFELDRVDYRLGSPENTVILASSENHDDSFVLVPEEHLTHITNWPGEPAEQLIRADLAYIETETGGAIFSTGSITFCGSLPVNNFQNNISTLLDNVFHRFLTN